MICNPKNPFTSVVKIDFQLRLYSFWSNSTISTFFFCRYDTSIDKMLIKMHCTPSRFAQFGFFPFMLENLNPLL